MPRKTSPLLNELYEYDENKLYYSTHDELFYQLN